MHDVCTFICISAVSSSARCSVIVLTIFSARFVAFSSSRSAYPATNASTSNSSNSSSCIRCSLNLPIQHCHIESLAKGNSMLSSELMFAWGRKSGHLKTQDLLATFDNLELPKSRAPLWIPFFLKAPPGLRKNWSAFRNDSSMQQHTHKPDVSLFQELHFCIK